MYSSHELARRLLELPDIDVVLTEDGEAITGAHESTYDDGQAIDVECITLETGSEEESE
jgi:hypothetical protein